MLSIYLLAVVASLCFHCACGAAPSAKPTANPTTIFNTACPSGWTTGNDRCYLLESGDKSWQDCKSYCSSKSGYLPCILGTYQSDFIRTLHPTTAGFTWIGYNDLTSEGSFVWDNGCSNTFTDWQANDPNNFNNNEDCGALVTANNQWGDLPCSSGFGCTCEQQFSSTGNACPLGWTLSLDGTYCIYFENTPSTFTACDSSCTAKSATMLCIRDAAENAFIYKLRSAKTLTWIGYNRASGSYQWPAGCTSTYVNWSPGEGSGPNEYYGAIYNGFTNGQWGDIAIDRAESYCACQKPASVLTVAPTVQPSRAPTTGPTAAPTIAPSTTMPTVNPSANPTVSPSAHPTKSPTAVPTAPSPLPTAAPTEVPTAIPSEVPSTSPTLPPSAFPTETPTTTPTCSPSAAPTSYLTIVLSSPTYRVRNGFSFAGLGSEGSVHTWGEADRGGDSSAVLSELTGNVSSVVSSRNAFAAVRVDGSVVPWGTQSTIHNENVAHPPLVSLIANEGAFAGITADTGAVYAFGAHQSGGNVLDDSKCHGCSTQLSSNVVSIAASATSFAALKADGTVYTWGNLLNGGGVSSLTMPALVGATMIAATREAFAALLSTGRVISWGAKLTGGGSSAVESQLLSGVIHLIASKGVFVAFKASTGIVVWGYPQWGGDASSVASDLTSGVVAVAQTFTALAALKRDGTVVAWGKADGGGDASAVQAQLVNVVHIVGAGKAFAALTDTGKVVAWGKEAYGGQIPSNKLSALSSGVVSIYHTDRAFAALKSDGSVVVWGQAGHGGSPGAAVEALLVSGVHTICSNDAAFSVIKTDGSVVGWGHPVSISTAGVLFNSSAFQGNVTCVW